MKLLAPAIVATVLLSLAAAWTADAKQSGNGPQLTGLALPPVRSRQPIVNAVTLPSGETIDLR